ncbi:MAG: serine/threonine-protein kinase, partial [Pseudomonadota bacterium]
MTDKDDFATGGGIETFRRIVDQGPDPLVDQVLGNYKILGLIAEGGMGRIYRAERVDGSFERQVAIKLVPSMGGQDHLKRFELERHILASLIHRNIAQLHDAGVAEDKSLFLVMELIRGSTIDVFSRQERLNVRHKVRLMLQLCEALSFAHSKLIVHRDVKPSNVMVDENGNVKLLDFGISKILESPQGLTVHHRPMTPKYASPEQLLNEPVSVASDIYQTGLLFLSLFEQRSDLEEASLESATDRAIRKTSITVSSQLAEVIPLELAAIINKCLRADPQERYAAASELSLDLGNYLSGYPVSARNPNRVQRGLKFIKRNWLPTSAVALVFLSLVTFLGISLKQQAETEAARELADQERNRAEQTTEFLVGLFNANRPQDSLGEQLSAKDILERGLQRLSELEDLELKTQLLDTISSVYRNLGDSAKALELASRSLELKLGVFPVDSTEIATSHYLIGRLALWSGKYEQAFKEGSSAYEIFFNRFGLANVQTLDALYVVGTAQSSLGNFSEAEKALTRSLEGSRQLHGENHTSVTTALNNLAVLYADQGKYLEALPLMEEVLGWNKVQIP